MQNRVSAEIKKKKVLVFMQNRGPFYHQAFWQRAHILVPLREKQIFTHQDFRKHIFPLFHLSLELYSRKHTHTYLTCF